MSAIVGMVHTDGRPASPNALKDMLATLAHRSPDGTAVWHEGPVGLGHGRLTTTLTDAALLDDREFAITADCRLDNRDELVASLGLAGRSPSDAAILLAAYRRWHHDCPAHLLGDFAFAIWDRQRRELFCARDHFGVKPFYFSAGRDRFIFASEMKALLAVGVSPAIDEARVADYLAAFTPDIGATFYRAIERLPPHHSLTISSSGRELRCYWSLAEIGEPLRGADLPEQFREIFTQAVASRLGGGRVGAMLSGGLDSSSIASVASRILADSRQSPLTTVSLVFDNHPDISERDHIEAVLAHGGFDPLFASSDGFSGFDDFERILAEQDAPFLAPGLAISERTYALAASRGIRVLLDGHGGDEVVSHGYGRLHELARGGRWIALLNEARGVAATYGQPTWPVFAAYASRHGPGRHLARLFRSASRGRQSRPDGHGMLDHIDPDLAARTGLVTRLSAHRRSEAEAVRTERTRHAWLLSSGMVPHAFEVLDRSAARAGVEPRYPFWDKRMVEFCLRLPPNEKLDAGWPRLILRRAMEGILPPSIQWRRDKLDFAPHVARGMVDSPLVEEVLCDNAGSVGQYVDLKSVRQAYGRLTDRGEQAGGYDVQAVWRTVVLALWLRQLQHQPQATRHAVAV